MAAYQFLSDEWFGAAATIFSANDAEADHAMAKVRMNLVVSDVPFGSGALDAHVDTSAGLVEIAPGHLAAPEVTVHLPYDIARAILIDNDTGKALQAFVFRKLRVDGDLQKLLAFQGRPPGPEAMAVAERIRAITS